MRLLSRLPPDGLIVDLRGNPGGLVWAAERLLQLFTPHPVTTTRFSMVISRSRNGANIGGPLPFGTPARSQNQRSTPSSHCGSRSRRLSWLIRWLRVSSE